MSTDNIKTFAQGALGAMTFGMYHMYVTNGLIENNNVQNKLAIKQIERQSELSVKQSELSVKQSEKQNELAIKQRDRVIDDLAKKIENLEKRRWFW